MDTVEPTLALDAADSAPPAAPAPPTPPMTAELPSIADGVERSLDPRSVTVHRIAGGLVNGAIALGLLGAVVIVLVVPIPVWIKGLVALVGIALAVALAWLAWRWPEVEHRHASYRVDGDGIEIRRGVVWRKVINVPRSRVQHTDVSQGPVERSFGLGTLVLYTAGTRHARVDLAGLEHAAALRIRDHFLTGDADDAV